MFKKLVAKLNNLKVIFVGLAVTGATSVSTNVAFDNQKKQQTEKAIQNIKEHLKRDSISKIVKNPVRTVRYKVDTLEKKSHVLLYYLPDIITRNFVKNDNLYKMKLYLFAHEDWHAHNHRTKYRSNPNFTPHEYYKLCMHDEISANIASLYILRYEYMLADNKEEFLSGYSEGYFSFYFNAIKNKEIDPLSTNPEDIENENRMVVNGMIKQWMEVKYRYGLYPRTMFNMLGRYVQRFGLANKDKHAEEYNKILKQMYNIGGLDLAKYIEQDVMSTDVRVILNDAIQQIKMLKKSGKFLYDNINSEYDLLRQIGIEKRKEFLQHMIFAAQLKYELRNKSEAEINLNPQLVELTYKKITSLLVKDRNFIDMIQTFPVTAFNICKLKNDEKEYTDFIHQLYTYKGVDLTSKISNFNPNDVILKSDKIYNNGNFSLLSPDYCYSNLEYIPLISDVNRNKSSQKDNAVKSNIKKPERVKIYELELPNLWDNILNTDDQEAIKLAKQTVKNFIKMPDILKECDVEAQKNFIDSLRKHNPKLYKNYQQKGFVDEHQR